MEDYFNNDFDFESEDFNIDDFIKYFTEKYGVGPFDASTEHSMGDDIDNLSNEGFGMEDLMEEDSKFVEIMEKLEEVRFEKMMNENFINLKKNGLSIYELKHQSEEDVKRVVATIKVMQETFLEREEYEKCAVLRPIITELEKEFKI